MRNKPLQVTDEAVAILRRGLKAQTSPQMKAGSRKTNGHPAPEMPAPAAEPADTAENGKPASEKGKKRGFVHSGGRIFWVDEASGVRTFICTELRVVADTCDPDGNAWGRLLVWHDPHGREHRAAIPMESFAGESVALRALFYDGGGDIGTSRRSRELFLQFIQTERPGLSCVCVPRIGWHARTFVLPGATIPQTDEVLLQTRERIDHAWRTAGTLKEWRERIGVKCANNTRLVFAASMAFAAPLLRPLKVEGGGAHLVGITSSGKTTAQQVAGSVCGGGGSGFCRSWRTTANAIEGIAELHNDGLLVLDELSEMPNPREIDVTVYMLSNGQGKARATASAALQRSRTWLTLFLSSGEVTLSEHAQAAGVRIKGGSEVRLLNIPADAGEEAGVFEDLHGVTSAGEFANQLKAAAGEVYGTPLRAFLEKWTADFDMNCNEARQSMNQFVGDSLPSGAAPEVGRAMRRIALIAAAGELAAKWEITGWAQGEAIRAAKRIAEDWIAARGGIGQVDVEAGIREVRAFIATKGVSHFQAVDPEYDRFGNPLRERMVERAGFYQTDKDGERVYLVFPAVFRAQICAGRNSRAILRELKMRGLLEEGDAPHWNKKVRIPNEGSPRFYAIKAAILEEDGNEAKGADNVGHTLL